MHAAIRLLLAIALVSASLGFASIAPCVATTQNCCPMSRGSCASMPDCALRVSNAELSARLPARTHGRDPAATAVLPSFLQAPRELTTASRFTRSRVPQPHPLPRYLELRSLRL